MSTHITYVFLQCNVCSYATYVPVHVYIMYFVSVWLTLRCTLSRLIKHQSLQWLHALLSWKNIYSTIEQHIWNAADAFMKGEGMNGLHNTCFPQSGGIAAARHWSIAVTRLPTRCAREPFRPINAYVRGLTSPCQNRENRRSARQPQICARFPKSARTGVKWRDCFTLTHLSQCVCLLFCFLFVYTPNGF